MFGQIRAVGVSGECVCYTSVKITMEAEPLSFECIAQYYVALRNDAPTLRVPLLCSGFLIEIAPLFSFLSPTASPCTSASGEQNDMVNAYFTLCIPTSCTWMSALREQADMVNAEYSFCVRNRLTW